jgi:hypothetical protein
MKVCLWKAHWQKPMSWQNISNEAPQILLGRYGLGIKLCFDRSFDEIFRHFIGGD